MFSRFVKKEKGERSLAKGARKYLSTVGVDPYNIMMNAIRPVASGRVILNVLVFPL